MKTSSVVSDYFDVVYIAFSSPETLYSQSFVIDMALGKAKLDLLPYNSGNFLVVYFYVLQCRVA